MNNLRILAYHRVADLDESAFLTPRLISATPSVFASQMKYLAKFYNVVSIEDVVNAVQMRGRLPKRAVLITFDDAYYDFEEIAWPILKKYGLTATVFVPTAYPDNPKLSFWWDRLHRAIMSSQQTQLRFPEIGTVSIETPSDRFGVLNSLYDVLKKLPHEHAMQSVDDICSELNYNDNGHKGILGWEALRRLVNEGVSLGPHTQTHPILTQLSPKEVRDEIRGSIKDLEREIGEIPPVFCYPNGNFDNHTTEILKDEGILLAFTTIDGHNKLNRGNLLCLQRTGITRKTSLFIFRLRLLRIFSYLDRLRHRSNRDYPQTIGK